MYSFEFLGPIRDFEARLRQLRTVLYEQNGHIGVSDIKRRGKGPGGERPPSLSPCPQALATDLPEPRPFLSREGSPGTEPHEITVTATPREIMITAGREREQASVGQKGSKLRWTELRCDNVFDESRCLRQWTLRPKFDLRSNRLSRSRSPRVFE